MSFWDDLHYFDASEFEPHADDMDEFFMRKLDHARALAGVAFKITSHYRPADVDSSHGAGFAVDIACSDSRTRYHILRGLFDARFDRVGVYDRHIHVDGDPDRDPQVVWWGTSK